MRAETQAREREIAALAARQHGRVAGWQLEELGLGRGAIRHRVAVKRLHRVHQGVFAVGHVAGAPQASLIAAVLACGRGAVLSHRSAVWLWGLGPDAAAEIDVTAPGSGRRNRGRIVVHEGRLHDEDRAEVDGIPVTSVARTLLDFAEVARPEQLRRAFEQAERLRLFDLKALDRVRARCFGRHGLRPLNALLAEWAPVELTRSDLEDRFLDLCRKAGLPMPRVNVVVAGLEVDMFWPHHGLVVELDGYAFHHTRAAFERDRLRDEVLRLGGHTVLRLTDRRLTGQPGQVVETMRSLLAESGP